MKKVLFSIGLNDKDSKLQQISTLEAYKVVQNLICNIFGGGTIFEAKGIYTHEDGGKIVENTLRCEVYDFCGAANFDSQVKEFCEIVKKMLNQESISVERATVQSELM